MGGRKGKVIKKIYIYILKSSNSSALIKASLHIRGHGCDRTRVSGINPEALVPKAAQQDESIVGRDDETLRADLDALIQQVWDLAPVAAHVRGCRRGRQRETAEVYSTDPLQEK